MSLDDDVKKFLAAGGKIQVIPTGSSTFSEKQNPWVPPAELKLRAEASKSAYGPHFDKENKPGSYKAK